MKMAIIAISILVASTLLFIISLCRVAAREEEFYRSIENKEEKKLN